MRSEGKEKFLKYLQIAPLVCTLTVGLSWFALWNDFVSTRPRSMDVSVGRVIPLASHGVVVYLTKEEGQRLSLLNHTGELVAAAFLLFLSGSSSYVPSLKTEFGSTVKGVRRF